MRSLVGAAYSRREGLQHWALSHIDCQSTYEQLLSRFQASVQ
jgi:hypothetical protein